MIISISLFVYSAEIRTIKMVLSHCALSLIGSLNWCGGSCIGLQLIKIVGQSGNAVSGRLDINIIPKWLGSSWDGKPGAWLCVMTEGACE